MRFTASTERLLAVIAGLTAAILVSAAPTLPSSPPGETSVGETSVFGLDIAVLPDGYAPPVDAVLLRLSLPPPTAPPSGNDTQMPFRDTGRVKCETSSASPTVSEINGARKEIERMDPQMCVVTNKLRSKCSTLAKHKGGQIGLCGGYRYTVHCQWLELAADWVAKTCVRRELGNRAGGIWYFSNQIWAIIF